MNSAEHTHRLSLGALYTVAARDQSELSVTVPFVAFGVARYLYLVHRNDLGEEPEKVPLQDTPTLLSVHCGR